MILRGQAAALLPFAGPVWETVIGEELARKGRAVVDRNVAAFAHGVAVGSRSSRPAS